MLWPFLHAPLYLSLFLSSLHTIYATFAFVWFCCTYWLIFISCGVKDVWAFGLIFASFYPFLDQVSLGHNPLSSCWAHAFFSLWPWAFWPLILPYHFIMPAITLPLLLFLITPWACGLMFLPWQPISSSIFCLGLPWLTFHIFTSFGLVSQHSYHARSFHYFIPRASSAYLLLLYPFYSYGIFAKFFRLPHPITTSLPLITFGLISL